MKEFWKGRILVLLLMCSGMSGILGQIVVSNPLDFDRTDAAIYIDVKTLGMHFQGMEFVHGKFVDGEDIPFQWIDADSDNNIDGVLLVLDIPANSARTIMVERQAAGETLNFTKRTQAEISHKVGGAWEGREYFGGEFVNVNYFKPPPQHTDHSWYIRYEGPGWESDKVGYRFYLDWRNATDIFGKLTSEMVLQNVGQDGFDSYHEPAPWGMDILKVGESLGIGALGYWVDERAMRVADTDSFTCRISYSGDLESKVRTYYYGWQIGDKRTDASSLLSIQAGSRMTKHEIVLSQSLPNLCTGIVKADGCAPFYGDEGEWSYLATWGNQSLAGDQLGMAVMYRSSDLLSRTEDAHSHVVVLHPENRKLTYYFLAAWEQEPGGITTETDFRGYLDRQLLELSNPPVVTFK
jgi:hypothetical protein